MKYKILINFKFIGITLKPKYPIRNDCNMYINEKLNEFNEYIKFRKVAVIGLGVSNLPLLDYLHDKKANVTILWI